MKYNLIITCEHATNHVPPMYAHLFKEAGDILISHRGWDPGAIEVAALLSQDLHVPLFASKASRLLIETNRSDGNHQQYSAFTVPLGDEEKQNIHRSFYQPYRSEVQSAIEKLSKPVVHISVHTFTPFWSNVPRRTDVGLLFDPDRKLETIVCTALKKTLLAQLPGYQVDFNEPYLGTDDGFTTYLRTIHRDEDYAGVEIEINQKFVGTAAMQIITEALRRSLVALG